jgi:hypothetical protein
MGLVGHEAPRLTDYEPWAYEGYDSTRPLEADMVLSIETTMAHPKRGFIKLEDTVAVTEEGCVGFGDEGARLESARITIQWCWLVDLENCARELTLRKGPLRISSSKAFFGDRRPHEILPSFEDAKCSTIVPA